MKALLAILGGFVLTLAIFGSGLAFATWLLAAKPVQQAGPSLDSAELWTREPRVIDVAAQNLQRLPARPVPPDSHVSSQTAVADAGTDTAAEAVDTATTGSVQPENEEQQQPASAEMVAAHVEWCANRYRSYRPRDNSYTPYSGGRRPCISPYSDRLAGTGEGVSPLPSDADSYFEDEDERSAPPVDYVSDEAGGIAQVTSEHLEYCFSRYRSYRPEDNTYQPYGGGPRRQCQ